MRRPLTQRAQLLHEAAAASPTLASLTDQVRHAQRMLACVKVLLPPALQPLVQAGPPDGRQWTILVPHAAAASKLRQLVPHLLQALQQQGHPLDTLRVKVLQPRP